jgi:hypothetical protein
MGGNLEGKIRVWRSRRVQEDSIRMDLIGIELEVVEYFRLAQNRVQWRMFVNTAMNIMFTYLFIKFNKLLGRLNDSHFFLKVSALWRDCS